MNLFEFFGSFDIDNNNNKSNDSTKLSREEEQQLADQVFWFILDDDGLHKKYFLPIAREIRKNHNDNTGDRHDWKSWIPMVNSACARYFKEHNVKGNPKDVFNKMFRKNLCKKLCDHYHIDIVKGVYNLGH